LKLFKPSLSLSLYLSLSYKVENVHLCSLGSVAPGRLSEGRPLAI
jgi:hypothetical protein